jgi:hypothetical protein
MHRLPFSSEGRESWNVGDIFHGEVGMVSVPTYYLLNYDSLLKGDPSEFADVKIIKKEKWGIVIMS